MNIKTMKLLDSAVTRNIKGVRALLKAGFKYVIEKDNLMIFRKRK